MQPKTQLVKIGDFLFKYRNAIFPAFLIVLFFSFKTRHAYYNDPDLEEIKDKIAVGITVCGLLLRGAVIGFRYIKRGGVNKKVYAEHLVTDGFFAVCRNPLYVANFIIYAGVLLMHGAPGVFFIGMAFFGFAYTAIVAAEEYFLRKEFGAAYDAYCADVPRWGFRLSRLRGATAGMKFNLKRALVKDYGTIANAIVSLTLLEVMEDVQFEPEASWTWAMCIVFGTVLAAIAVHYAKKNGTLTAS